MAYVVVDVGAVRILLAGMYVKVFFYPRNDQTAREQDRKRESDVTTMKDEYW